MAGQIGVDPDTVFRWESNESSPSVSKFPAIIRFLGYDPFPIPTGLSARLQGVRKRLGLSQAAMALKFGVDPTTLRKWEKVGAKPSTRLLSVLKVLPDCYEIHSKK